MEPTNVRVLGSTNKLIDDYETRVNAARAKKGMFKLTKMQVIDIAVKKLKDKDGMK